MQIVENQIHDQLRRNDLDASTVDDGECRTENLVPSHDFVEAPLQERCIQWRRQPERVVQAISRPNKDAAKQFVLAWVDTREARPVESRAYAFLNDTEQTVSTDVVEALRAYDVRPVPWSHRDEVREELAA